MADDYELGTVGPIPTVNPNVAKIGELLNAAKTYANQYYVKDYVPLIGGTQLGDFLLGQAPEEVQRWGQGDYPVRNPSEVTGTGGNRLDIWKTGRFEPTFDVATNVVAPTIGAAKLTKGLPVGLSIKDVSKEAGNIVKSKPDDMGFYSSLENAVAKIQQPKGTGDQILKQLEKTPGVKTEELEHTGLKTYLQEHPTVTKQELTKFMNENRISLDEHILTNEGESVDNYQLHGGDVHYDHDYVSSLYNDLHHDMVNDPDIYNQEKEAIKQQFPEEYAGHETDPEKDAALHEHVKNSLFAQAKQSATDMYYENPLHHYYDDFGYDVYGNDDVGYTFKTQGGAFIDLGGRNGIYDISDAEAALRNHHLDTGRLEFEDQNAKYEDYTLPGPYSEYREILSQLPANLDPKILGSKKFQDARKNISTNSANYELGDMLRRAERKDFESSHYDQPNILGHLRLTNRNINGKKTLMVEEIQSDWHQAGRKKGYADESKRTAWDHPEYVKARNESVDALNAFNSAYDNPTLQAQLKPELERAKAAEDVFANANRKASEGVPDAPFKKNWHEMLMKQALDIAAKGDYEGVAFTTGKQQAERYNLAKQVDEIRYKKTGEDKYSIAAVKNGHEVIVKENLTPNELSDYLGNEVSKKITEGEGTKVTNEKADYHSLSNMQLQIGGEGMKGFYDKILPDFVNKYGKKWGIAVKKANLEHSGGSLKTEDIEEGIRKQGYTLDEYKQLPPNEKMKIFNKIAGEEVHYFDMPEHAKKDIMENGQPLFAGIGLAGVPMMGPDDQKKHGIFKDIAKSKK
jgi:hypothetical protein